MEDHSDEAATRERARLLREAGFEDSVVELTRDPDLDVRERAKSAVDVLARLNGEVGGRRERGQFGGSAGVGFVGEAGGVSRGLEGWGRERERG